MSGSGVALVVVLLGAPVLLALAFEGRARRQRAGARLYVKAAMGASLAVYTVFATGVASRALAAPDGPAWWRLLIGLARSSPAEVSLLVVSAVATLGSWWMLREGEASSATAPSPPLPGEE